MYVTSSMRKMYYQTEETEEDRAKDEQEQRSADTYAALKTALQNRFYDILLNWDLFVPA